MLTLKHKICLVMATLILGLGILGMGFSTVATAQTPSELENIYNCKTITEADARLACYDSAVGRLEAAQNSGDIVAVSKTEIEKIESEAFGFKIPSLPRLSQLFGSGSRKTTSDNTQNGDNPDVNADEANRKKTFARPETKRVIYNIRKTEKFAGGKLRFYFENDQVWEQVDSDRIYVRKARNGEKITGHIRRASLGSYLLRVNGKSKSIRVRRVK